MTGPRILFSGYFGFGNFGDDAILYCMARQFKKMRPDIQLSVLADDVHEQERGGIPSDFESHIYKRMNPVHILRAIKNCDLFISGGGGLFQDSTSVKSVVYYAGLIHLALRMKKKVILFSQGLGPLNSLRARKIVSGVLKNVHEATFRDEASCALAKELSGRDFECAADPVFLLEPPEGDVPFPDDVHLPDEERWKPRIGIALRLWLHKTFDKELELFLEGIVKESTALLLLSFQRDDTGVARRLKEMFKKNAFVCPVFSFPPLMLAHYYRRMDLCLCMRYHSAVCAFLAGKPALGFSYDPKVRELFDDFGLSEFCLPLDATQQDMISCYEKLLKSREDVVQKIKRHLPVMKERALKSFTLALEMV